MISGNYYINEKIAKLIPPSNMHYRTHVLIGLIRTQLVSFWRSSEVVSSFATFSCCENPYQIIQTSKWARPEWKTCDIMINSITLDISTLSSIVSTVNSKKHHCRHIAYINPSPWSKLIDWRMQIDLILIKTVWVISLN